MMTTVSLPLYLTMLANAALVVAATFAMFRFDRSLRAAREDPQRPAGSEEATGAKPASASSQVQIMATLATLQRSVSELQQREPVQPAGQVVDLSLEHAVRMAKRGAAVDELTRDCGLNEGEAELLCRLHGPRSRVAPAAREA